MTANGGSVEERSAGGVVVHQGQVLLISPDGRHWRLPKGRLEVGEGAAAAALREVREETGVAGSIVSPLSTIRYSFRRSDGLLVDKQVAYFLMRYESGSEADHDPSEVAQAAWHRAADAVGLLRFADEQRVLCEALERATSGEHER